MFVSQRPFKSRRNLESQRRQHSLADRARQLGWSDVEVFDDDLGRSGAGGRRPGFEKLLAAICEGLIDEAADVHLDYTAGGDIPLLISLASGSATALLLRGPDGAWYCDAGGEGTPGLRFTRPQAGRYTIWVASPVGAQAVELRFSANLTQ